MRFLSLAALLTFALNSYADGKVAVDVKLKPAGSFKAETSKVNGEAYKTADGVEAKDVWVDATSLKTGVSLRDTHLKQRLMTDKHPKVKLIKASGKNGKGKATLEIKGMRYEAEGTYEIKGKNLLAKFIVNLPKLDIKDVKYMGVGAADDVVVNVELPLKEKAK